MSDPEIFVATHWIIVSPIRPRQTHASARLQASPAFGDEEGCAASLRAAPFCARAACTRARSLASNPFGCKHEAENGRLRDWPRPPAFRSTSYTAPRSVPGWSSSAPTTNTLHPSGASARPNSHRRRATWCARPPRKSLSSSSATAPRPSSYRPRSPQRTARTSSCVASSGARAGQQPTDRRPPPTAASSSN